jgi:8-oxo-dGTP pyrophosphatase MutT (NUDIX family)
MDPFLRHIAACNNAALPGRRRPLLLGDAPVGWVLPPIAEAMRAIAGVSVSAERVTLAHPARLPQVALTLAEYGLCQWRGEAFDVRAMDDGPVLAQVDRGALPCLGIAAVGVHVNGLVRAPDGLHVWVARRAANKLLDPGKLDHIVAGGVAAGMTVAETLLKEAREEAAIPSELAARAVPVARLGYAMERSEGLRRDRLHCYDLALPPGFRPVPVDGEVADFTLWPITQVYDAVRDGDAFKFNVNLVLIDLFLRLEMIQGASAGTLRAALDAAG